VTIPPDEPGHPPAGEDGAADAVPEGTDAAVPEAPVVEEDDAIGARGLVVVGEHPDVPAAAAPSRETAGPVVVSPVPDLSELEEEGDPSRRWKIAAALLGVAVIVLAAVAIERGSSSAEAGTAVTPEQETALENVVTVPADELAAKSAQLEQLQKDSAAAAAAADQAATDNAALQQQLDAAAAQAKAAEQAAQEAITDANRSGASAAEANKQVDALTKQVASLNQQIGSLTAQTTTLSDQNAKLQKSNTELAAANEAVTAQLTALDGVQTKLYTCTQGLVEAVRQQDDPSWWEQHGEATTATCTTAKDAIDAYNAKYG
jgi:chemotaxis protein histidine kinase CheA